MDPACVCMWCDYLIVTIDCDATIPAPPRAATASTIGMPAAAVFPAPVEMKWFEIYDEI